MMASKLRLEWNDFKDNVFNVFENLSEDKEFADVTLACKDGKQVMAHKGILASSSSFFKNILRANSHLHPIIYMKGVCSEELQAIVELIYCGKANLLEENLNSFLALAEELQLKGFNGAGDGDSEKDKSRQATQKSVQVQKEETISSEKYSHSSQQFKEPTDSDSCCARNDTSKGHHESYEEVLSVVQSTTNNFLTSGIRKPVDIGKVEVDGHMVDNSDQMSNLVDEEVDRVAYSVLDHVTGQEMNMNTFVEQFLKPVLITLNLRWLDYTIAKLPQFCKRN